MGNAASVIPNKLHTAREAVGHTAHTAREAFEHTASTAREAVRNGVHHHHHGRKVTSSSSSTTTGAVQQQQPPRKGDRDTPAIAESKHDDEQVPGGGGRPPSRGNDSNNNDTSSSRKRAENVRDKAGESRKGAPSSAARARGLAADDKATFEGGSSSRTQDQRGDAGVLQQHRNSRRGEVGHSSPKNLQQQGTQDRGSGRDLGERSSREDAASVGTTSGSSGGSYTSSSYSSSGSDDSCDDDASDDTFFVPQVFFIHACTYDMI